MLGEFYQDQLDKGMSDAKLAFYLLCMNHAIEMDIGIWTRKGMSVADMMKKTGWDEQRTKKALDESPFPMILNPLGKYISLGAFMKMEWLE